MKAISFQASGLSLSYEGNGTRMTLIVRMVTDYLFTIKARKLKING